MDMVFGVAHGKENEIPLRMIPMVAVSTWLTHLFGGSAGREGVAIQIGATLGHNISKKIHAENAGKILIDSAQAGVVRCGGILAHAYGDTSVGSIHVSSCSFTGSMEVDVASHSTLYVKAITGLYSDIVNTETDCLSSGSVRVK